MPFPQLHDKTHKCILIVDDDHSIRETLKLMLNMEGYLVFTACNGQEAIEKIKALAKDKKPCLILSDLHMPLMSGDELFEILQNCSTMVTVPMAIMTASEHSITGAKIIRKPFSMETILRLAHEACVKNDDVLAGKVLETSSNVSNEK